MYGPKMSSVFMVTSFGLFLYSLIACSTAESLASVSEEEQYQSNVCAGLSICNFTLPMKKGLYKCMCDSNCSFYGDCCPESPYHNLSVQLHNRKNDMFSCPEKFGFYVINKCPSDFADQEVKQKCENTSIDRDYKDFKIMRPVLEKASRKTYLNAYCALCNGVTDFEKFKLGYECKVVTSDSKLTDRESLKQLLLNAKFNNETKQLTSTLYGAEFVCVHIVIVPTELKPYRRYCEPKMILSCPETFNDSKIVEACNSVTYAVYTSPYIGEGDVYKNIDCAKCNGVNSTSITSCQIEDIPEETEGASSLFLQHHTGSCDDPDMVNIPFCSAD